MEDWFVSKATELKAALLYASRLILTPESCHPALLRSASEILIVRGLPLVSHEEKSNTVLPVPTIDIP